MQYLAKLTGLGIGRAVSEEIPYLNLSRRGCTNETTTARAREKDIKEVMHNSWTTTLFWHS